MSGPRQGRLTYLIKKNFKKTVTGILPTLVHATSIVQAQWLQLPCLLQFPKDYNTTTAPMAHPVQRVLLQCSESFSFHS